MPARESEAKNVARIQPVFIGLCMRRKTAKIISNMGGKIGRGFSRKNRRFSADFLRVVYGAGMASMLLMSAYAFSSYTMFRNDLLAENFYLFGMNINWILALFFAGFGIFEYTVRPKSRPGIALVFAIRIASTIVFANFICGDPGVVQLFWMVLFITSGLTFGWLAMSSIIAIMTVDMFVDWFISGAFNRPHLILSATISTVIIIAVSILTVRLREIGVVKLDIYEELKKRERIGQRRLDAIINSVNDAMLSVDRTGKINFYNPATMSLFDTNKDLVGKNIDDFLVLTDEDNNKIDFAKILPSINTNTERQDFIHTYSDGEKINLFIEISPVRSVFGSNRKKETDAGLILVIRDITKQKSLDDERDEFISVVSHELRTPVAITEGSLSNLQLLIAKNADPKTFSTTLDSAHDQVLYLGKMVNDLSTLSRAQRGVYMDPENINVEEFANSLFQKYLPEAKSRKLALDLDVEAKGDVLVSRMAIEEIMQNLITNSLKYTREGGVTISVKFAKDSGKINKNKVEFIVKDTGIGISISDQKHVFERFWRSEDYRTRETGGTGLGLHIVEQLARKIGTRLQLKSRINHGSEFSFSLPLLKK